MCSWKQKMSRFLVVGLSVASIALAGCGHSDTTKTAAPKGYPVSWTETLDGKEYTFSVDRSPTHAVSMSQATTEMLLALGLEKKMVGTAFQEEDIYEPLQKAYNEVPVLAEKWPSYEVLMATKPDFITGWDVPFTKKAIPAATLHDAGVKIFVPMSMLKKDATLDTFFEDMLTFGKIFDVNDKAAAFVAEQKKKLTALKASGKDSQVVKVFVFDSEDEQPFTVFEGYTTNVLRLVGLENVMANRGVNKTWGKTSWESVVEANPDYFLICDYGTSIRNTDDFDQKVAALKANPALQGLKAVQENHFIRVKLSEITPGVRTVDALARIKSEIQK